ncbi:hypothetical protein ACQEU8_21005 [Streptomyces sp. CA-250714]|uniref:hypothetical protein n=1 Tax=Streptomyces sp. CA-250714 TaxID=3240060 RepID=UPI003D8CCE77
MTAADLSAEWLTDWQWRTTLALKRALRSFESTFGYPPGDNEVVPADEESRTAAAQLVRAADIPAALVTFYTTVCELSLPDIDHGYFIHSPAQVRDGIKQYGLARVAERDAERDTAVVFGSDGGGILFALDHTGRVHRSTTPSWFGQYEAAAPSLAHYLDELHGAVVDFAVR